jgi:hypothetical protein
LEEEGKRLEMEKVMKQSKRWRNTKKSFTKMNKDKKMKDRIWIEMIQSNGIEFKKTMKKRRSRQTQLGTNKGDEKDDLTRI